MSKEIRELEENSKRIIENMRPQTIAQYHIKQWLDDNFIMGCARLEYTGKDTAKVMDTVGGVMYVEYQVIAKLAVLVRNLEPKQGRIREEHDLWNEKWIIAHVKRTLISYGLYESGKS